MTKNALKALIITSLAALVAVVGLGTHAPVPKNGRASGFIGQPPLVPNSGITTGAGGGGSVTNVSGGTGVTITNPTTTPNVALDNTIWQSRVTGTAGAHNAITAVGASGTITAAAFLDTPGTGLASASTGEIHSTVGADAFGLGTDGSVTFDGTTTILGLVPSSSVYTMTRPIHCHNCTVNAGVEIKSGGYPFFDDGTLTLNGKIDDNGVNANTTSAGTDRGAGWYTTKLGARNGGASNASPTATQDSNPTFCAPFVASATAATAGVNGTGGGAGTPGACNGGGGGGGTASTGGLGGATTVTAATNCGQPLLALRTGKLGPALALALGFGAPGGGGGGGAAANGGGGGNPGGIAYVAVYKLAGSGTIEAKGGNGGSPTASTGGGGGGGGGGYAIGEYMTNTGTVTAVATGGNGASGLGGGGAGGNGGSCFAKLINLSHDGT